MTTTTDSPELKILNVGHGNCALVRDGSVVYVIDVPKRDSVLKPALEQLAKHHGIKEIDSILVSHADEDHIGGVSALLTDEDLCVRRLYVNAEPLRRTDAWTAVRFGIRDTRRRCAAFEVDNLTSRRTADLRLPKIDVEVLAPGSEMALTGAGGTTPEGKRVSSNSMSAVIRFSTQATRGVLLTGDIDRVGLDALLAEHPQLEAEVLVFPHHGGLPGRANPQRFAIDLTAAVKPDVVVFSHGRQHVESGQEPTPRREIVAGVRQSCPDAYIACTQLSAGCARWPPAKSQRYLSDLRPLEPAAGSCCAGTLEFRFLINGLGCGQLRGHAEWIEAHVPRRVCASR